MTPGSYSVGVPWWWSRGWCSSKAICAVMSVKAW